MAGLAGVPAGGKRSAAEEVDEEDGGRVEESEGDGDVADFFEAGVDGEAEVEAEHGGFGECEADRRESDQGVYTLGVRRSQF